MNSHTQGVWYVGINIFTREIENCALIVIDDHFFNLLLFHHKIVVNWMFEIKL